MKNILIRKIIGVFIAGIFCILSYISNDMLFYTFIVWSFMAWKGVNKKNRDV